MSLYYGVELIYQNGSYGEINLSEKFSLPSTREVFDIAGRIAFRQELTEETKSCDLSHLK